MNNVSFTVVPLHNLDFPAGTVIRFGRFAIQDVPQWLLKESILEDLSKRDRGSVHQAKQALVSEYYADSYGYPDPEWTGTTPKSIQDLCWQSALLANMSMWMVMPSTVCVTRGFHALTILGGRQLESPIVNHIDKEQTLFCHERDLPNAPRQGDLRKAARLFSTLSTIPRKNSVWPALRAFWAALTSYPGDLRYPLFWQGLESLFGSDTDTNGVSKRLRDRISHFLADDAAVQRELHDKVKACYAERSAIVHGRWEDSLEFHDVHMYTTEAIVRTVVRHIADRAGMLNVFLSQERNKYLETLVKSNAFGSSPVPLRVV
jgi:hypothetical protein